MLNPATHSNNLAVSLADGGLVLPSAEMKSPFPFWRTSAPNLALMGIGAGAAGCFLPQINDMLERSYQRAQASGETWKMAQWGVFPVMLKGFGNSQFIRDACGYQIEVCRPGGLERRQICSAVEGAYAPSYERIALRLSRSERPAPEW